MGVVKSTTLSFFLLISPSSPVRLHIAHLHEVQGRYKQAKEAYELLVAADGLADNIKAAGLRQLG